MALSSARCKTLLGWYGEHARRLPWRDTTDAYHIWISEIMLQQTQVNTVLPRYAAWFDQFPSIQALADADEDRVMKAWEGLGYYRRARYIHRAAKQIVAEHQGQFPSDFAAIMALPGIGRSTAGAISSFSFGTATPVLDANVKRVLQRWSKADTTEKTLWLLAQQAIDCSTDPANWNQAMMELGAVICTARCAHCMHCPLSASCPSAFAVEGGKTAAKTTSVKDVHWQVNLHICPQKGIWLVKRPASGIWAGLWSPPIIEIEALAERKPDYIHLLTHRRLHLYSERITAAPGGEGMWVSSLADYAMPTGIHRLLQSTGVC